MNSPYGFPFVLARIAKETGHDVLWTRLTTALDQWLAAICAAGNRPRDELPPDVRQTLDRLDTTIANCHAELRHAATNDPLVFFLWSHSHAAVDEPLTLHRQLAMAGRLRELARHWESDDPQASAALQVIAEGLESDMQIHLYLDPKSEHALLQHACDLGGAVIPAVWQGETIPRLKLPLPPRRYESLAEIDALRQAGDEAGWKQAVIQRQCSSTSQLSLWFPQVISEQELGLPANQVSEFFPELYTSSEWPVLQLQIETPPPVVKRPSILSLEATYRSFRCQWNQEQFTAELQADFNGRLSTLWSLFLQIQAWCQANLVTLSPTTFCGLDLWKNDAKFRHDWEAA